MQQRSELMAAMLLCHAVSSSRTLPGQSKEQQDFHRPGSSNVSSSGEAGPRKWLIQRGEVSFLRSRSAQPGPDGG